MIEVRTQAQLDKAMKKTNGGKDELVVCMGGGHFVLRESSSAVLRESSSAVLWGSSSAVLRESSSAVLRESSSAVLRESSSAELWESSSAVLRESSSAVLRESSSAVLWGSSSAELRGSSSAELWESSSARALSARCKAKASKYAVVLQHNRAAKISGGRVLEMPRPETGAEWCEFYGVEIRKGGGFSRKLVGQDVAILFKAVAEGYKAARGFSYEPGSIPEASDWDGGDRECGGGLHFSPHPKMAKEFNRGPAHFVACPVLVSEIVVHPDGTYPQKVKAPRVAAPCWEVDEDGQKVEATQ